MRSGLLALGLLLACAAPAAAAPSFVKLGDFDQPVYVATPPDNSRIFVVEKPGRIKLVGGGTFLDLSSVVNGTDEERGLLSMAFSPGYASNGLFYVFYTDTAGDIRIVESRRSANPLVANPASARPIFFAEHSDAGFHNGGQLQVGSDGMLYASIGDRQDGNNAQNTANPFGKILRLNPATGGAAAGNPFGNFVWAYGLRNPWRFSFDRGTGDIAIGDVGSEIPQAREEVNWGAAPNRARGTNFGWPDNEGVGAIVSHPHSDGFCAIVGGYVVRDPGLPSLNGRYVYGDNCGSAIYATTPRTGANDGPTGLEVSGLASFGEDACGHIYAASLNGGVYRLQDGAVSPCTLGGGGQPSDTTAPGLKVGLAGVRKLLKTRRLRIGVRCSERCQATVGTRLRNVRRLKARHRTLTTGHRKVVRIKLSKAVARTLRKRVKRHGFVRIAVTVRATDAAGNVAKKVKRGRVKRRR